MPPGRDCGKVCRLRIVDIRVHEDARRLDFRQARYYKSARLLAIATRSSGKLLRATFQQSLDGKGAYSDQFQLKKPVHLCMIWL